MIKIVFKKHLLISAAFLAAAILLSSSSFAGVWQVNPIRLDFDQKNRSGVISIRNDAEEKLFIRAEAFEWVQKENGVDAYIPSNDLIFFPKQLTINPKEERVIRTGFNVPAVKKERTYRLFLKEEAEPQSDSPNRVVIAIQFGIPIFSKPVKEEISGALEEILLQNGTLNLTVHNTGNTHFRINTVTLKGSDPTGAESFSQELNGWYLLSGAARTHSATIPEDICQRLKTIEVQVNADRITLTGKIDVEPPMCSNQ
jgi:fimbrial chaperone protein